MTIYELLHITDYLDEKHIGYFSTIDNLKKAIEEIRKQPGFCQFPHNFFIIPREVIPPEQESKSLYSAGAFFYDDAFEVDGGADLGIFGQKADAEESLSLFTQIDENATDQWLTVDPSVGRVELDRVWWAEGFHCREEEHCDGSV